MKSFLMFLFLSLLTIPASAENITWQDLLRKPELRPAQCSLTETISFQSGMTLKKGQKFDILELNPDEVVVSMGNHNFSLMPNQTDIVAVANAEYNKMTPRQRSLTVAEVLKRRDLWPYRLKVKDTFDIGRQRIKKGDTVYLMDAKNGELVLVPPTMDMHFELKPEDTDILEQARGYLEQPNGAPGRLVEELQGKLINGVTGQPVKLDMNALPKYFVLYGGARWCPYTQQFTPELLKAYNQLKTKHPEFEVFYIPSEKSAAELQTYAKELNFPWPVLDYRHKGKFAVLATILGRSSLPEIEVADRHGNIIIDNYKLDREGVLKEFIALLDKSGQK